MMDIGPLVLRSDGMMHPATPDEIPTLRTTMPLEYCVFLPDGKFIGTIQGKDIYDDGRVTVDVRVTSGDPDTFSPPMDFTFPMHATEQVSR